MSELARDIRAWANGALLAAELVADPSDRALFQRQALEMEGAAQRLERDHHEAAEAAE